MMTGIVNAQKYVHGLCFVEICYSEVAFHVTLILLSHFTSTGVISSANEATMKNMSKCVTKTEEKYTTDKAWLNCICILCDIYICTYNHWYFQISYLSPYDMQDFMIEICQYVSCIQNLWCTLSNYMIPFQHDNDIYIRECISNGNAKWFNQLIYYFPCCLCTFTMKVIYITAYFFTASLHRGQAMYKDFQCNFSTNLVTARCAVLQDWDRQHAVNFSAFQNLLGGAQLYATMMKDSHDNSPLGVEYHETLSWWDVLTFDPK